MNSSKKSSDFIKIGLLHYINTVRYIICVAINAPWNRLAMRPSEAVECDWPSLSFMYNNFLPSYSYVSQIYVHTFTSLHLFTWCLNDNRHRLVWNAPCIHVFTVRRCCVADWVVGAYVFGIYFVSILPYIVHCHPLYSRHHC